MKYSFNINSETEKFELYYLKCICAGRARGLACKLAETVRTVQNEIGFEYIRFHGIFNDEMAV